MASPATIGIDLYWLPLGAGGRSVRVNGMVFEAVAAWLGGRDRRDLYHSALQVHVPEGRYVIEQAPAWSDGAERGVVAEGAVGARAAGRFRLFRYEVRRWHDGVIPDLVEAVESPCRLSDDPDCARRLLELVPAGADAGVGSRRARRGRDVELELADLLADRAQRTGGSVDPSPSRRTGPRVAGRNRHRAPPAGRESQPITSANRPNAGRLCSRKELSR